MSFFRSVMLSSCKCPCPTIAKAIVTTPLVSLGRALRLRPVMIAWIEENLTVSDSLGLERMASSRMAGLLLRRQTTVDVAKPQSSRRAPQPSTRTTLDAWNTRGRPGCSRMSRLGKPIERESMSRRLELCLPYLAAAPAASRAMASRKLTLTDSRRTFEATTKLCILGDAAERDERPYDARRLMLLMRLWLRVLLPWGSFSHKETRRGTTRTLTVTHTSRASPKSAPCPG